MLRTIQLSIILFIIPFLAQADSALIPVEGPAVAYGAWSLLPALLAIGMALLTRQVLLSLFAGIWAGAWLIAGGDFNALLNGFLRVIDTYLLRALVPDDGSTDHISIIVFTLLTGGMISIISRNGGLASIVAWIAKKANTPKKGQLSATISGLIIFFDDYANTLIVGNTMRPLMDRINVSREKLAYLVDTTAAPIASIALITTWVGFQVSLIGSATEPLEGIEQSSYELMISAIPYSFYSILSIAFIFMVILTNRDFGPMYHAEMAARNKAETNVQPEDYDLAQATHPINALLPILTLIGGVIFGLYYSGLPENGAEASLTDILGNANPFNAMLWASLSSVTVALFISLINSPLRVTDVIEALEKGLSPMLGAVTILTFAWAIAEVNQLLHTADYLTTQLADGLDPRLLPTIIFILAAMIAFATGTSWGVMAILVPLAIPLTWSAMQNAGLQEAHFMPILYATIASTLTGAVWGDHCSPISDTTILSSIASGCDHIAHVRTQLPYAATVGGISLTAGLLPVGYGLPWWAGLLISAALLYGVIRLLGRKVSCETTPKAVDTQ